MKSRIEAVIIGSVNLGEADKLVTFFSRERGRLSGVAKNAKKSFRRFGAALEIFSHSNLIIFEQEQKNLVRIESAEIVHLPSGISANLERLAVGSVMLELVREIAPEGDSGCGRAAFNLLTDTLRLLGRAEDPMFLLRIFEIKFLSLLGYQLRLDRCVSCGCLPDEKMIFQAIKGGVICPYCMVSSGGKVVTLSGGTVGFYYQALRMEMDKIQRLKPSESIMQELENAFAEHTFHIIGKRLKSKDFLMSVRSFS